MRALPFENHSQKHPSRAKGTKLSPEALRIKKIALRLNRVTDRELSDREVVDLIAETRTELIRFHLSKKKKRR